MIRSSLPSAALLVAGVALVAPDHAHAVELPEACAAQAIPSSDPAHPGEQLALICLPERANGNLLVYAHGYARPHEPIGLPTGELDMPAVWQAVDRFLGLGFAFATTSYAKNGYAVEQAGIDIGALVEQIRGREPATEDVWLIGASEGGIITTMLLEQHPEIYAGGLALCGPLAGVDYQIDYVADLRVVFDYFFPDVFPFAAFEVPADAWRDWKGPDGYEARIGAAIKGDMDATRQLFDVVGMACELQPDEAANCAQNTLAYSIFATSDLLETAGGQPYDNRTRRYRGSDDDAALNAGVERVQSSGPARQYVRDHYRTTGRLERPLVSLHTTGDPGVPIRHELIYRARVEGAGAGRQLTTLPVERPGHCNFKAAEVLGGLGLLLMRADNGLFADLLDQIVALGGTIDVGDALTEGTGETGQRLREEASDLADELKALGRPEGKLRDLARKATRRGSLGGH